jgi:hypothetical protein
MTDPVLMRQQQPTTSDRSIATSFQLGRCFAHLRDLRAHRLQRVRAVRSATVSVTSTAVEVLRQLTIAVREIHGVSKRLRVPDHSSLNAEDAE